MNVKGFNLPSIIIVISSIILSYFIFVNIFNGEFIWDDKLHISENPDIKTLDTKSIFNHFIPNDKYMYHPITMLSYQMEYHIAKNNPFIYHVNNFILHILTLLALFVLLKKLFNNNLLSSICVLLFAIHPLHIEPVAWLSGRKELLYTLFYLLSSIYYLNFIQKKGARNYIYSIIFFVLAILSKPSAAILFMTLLLFDYFQNNKLELKYLINKIPYIIGGLIIIIIPFTFERSVSGINSMTNLYPIIDRIFFPSYILLFYLIKFFIPINISAFYSFPIKTEASLLPIEYYISLPLLAVLVFLLIKLKFDKRYLIFGLAYFLINTLMVLHIVPFGTSIVADRYTYNSYIGLCIPIAYYLIIFFKERLTTLYLSIFVITTGLFIISYNRVNVWKSNIALWTDVIDTNKGNRKAAFAYYNRAVEYDANNLLELSLEDYNNCLLLEPEYKDAHINRGKIKFNIGDNIGALNDFEIAVKLNPNSYIALNNRANAYLSFKLYDKALKDYNKSLEISPNNTDALNNRGILFVDNNNLEAAINDYNKSIMLNPKNPQTYNSRAIAYFKSKKHDKAFQDWAEALIINNNYIRAYHNRAQAYYSLSEFSKAIEDYNNVIRLNDKHSEAYYFRGICYFYLKNNKKACKDWIIAQNLGYNDTYKFIANYCN